MSRVTRPNTDELITVDASLISYADYMYTVFAELKLFAPAPFVKYGFTFVCAGYICASIRHNIKNCKINCTIEIKLLI